VTWIDEGVASGHRVQRRARDANGAWSEWADVGNESGPQVALIDAGSGGMGLTPGVYAYRAQSLFPDPAEPAEGAWSDWSTPAEFTLPPQCAGGENPPGNEAEGSLQTVRIDDLDGNGRFTGADVWIALQRCSKLGGCVLEALPVTYDDVAINLYGQGDNRPCILFSTLVCEPMPTFPKGLVIQVHGSATVFRSPIWRTPYKPSAIFEFWHAPGVQLRFRNFVVDGRKGEQPDPTVGVNDENIWRHRGIDVTNYFGPDHRMRYPDGCVHNVTARNLFLSGIEVDHTKNWRIEYNRVEDIGCWKGLTECPRLRIPDTSPPPAWGCNGDVVTGYGLVVGNYSDDTHVTQNSITRASKYGMGIKGGSEGTDPIRRLLVAENRIENVGSVGMFLAGTIDSVVERNVIDGTHAYGCRKGGAWHSWGIQTNGTIRDTRVQNNELRNLANIAIGSNARVDGLAFIDNTIDNVCTERNAKVGSVLGAIQFGDGSSGTFELSRNRLTRNHCSMALGVGWGSTAQVIVDGGYYCTGENSDENWGAVYVESGNSPKVPRVRLKGGAEFEYLGIQRRPGIVASGNGQIVVEDRSVRVKNYLAPFSTVSSCMDRCATQKTGSIVRCDTNPLSSECP